LGVVYPQNPQKPKATAEKIRHRTRQANSSRMRFIFCPLFCVLLRGFPFAAHIYTRRRAAFTIRRNTYFAGSARQPNPGTPSREGSKVPANQGPANQGKRKGRIREGKAQPFKAKGREAQGEDGARYRRERRQDGAATHNPLMLRLACPPVHGHTWDGHTWECARPRVSTLPVLGYSPLGCSPLPGTRVFPLGDRPQSVS